METKLTSHVNLHMAMHYARQDDHEKLVQRADATDIKLSTLDRNMQEMYKQGSASGTQYSTNNNDYTQIAGRVDKIDKTLVELKENRRKELKRELMEEIKVKQGTVGDEEKLLKIKESQEVEINNLKEELKC